MARSVPDCSKCPTPACISLPYAGTHLCPAHFLRFFRDRAKREITQQGRLPEGTIAVALSGGKDSVAALHLLRDITRDHPRIRLVAVTVDEGIAGYRQGSLDICRQVTEEWGIPWRLVRTRDLAGYDIDGYASGREGPAGDPLDGQPRPSCGPCGVFRRVGVNTLAREAGAAAIVTGHNLDDLAQTILMNTLRGDVERMARLAPHGAPIEGLVPRLLPLRTIPEKEVLLYAVLHGLPLHHEEECPYAARSHRFQLRDVLVGLEATTPGTRHALVRGHDRLKPLLASLPQVPIAACDRCGEPTSAATCKACLLRAPPRSRAASGTPGALGVAGASAATAALPTAARNV